MNIFSLIKNFYEIFMNIKNKKGIIIDKRKKKILIFLILYAFILLEKKNICFQIILGII